MLSLHEVLLVTLYYLRTIQSTRFRACGGRPHLCRNYIGKSPNADAPYAGMRNACTTELIEI